MSSVISGRKFLKIINNSPDLYALTLYIVFNKNNLFLALLPGISANWNEIIDVITKEI